MSEENLDFHEPVPLGLTICDSVTRDLATGKTSLLGLFSGVVAATVPARVNFWAHAIISNVREDTEFQFMIVDSEDETVAKSPTNGDWMLLPKPADMMVEPILLAYFGGLELPRYGHYFVQVWTKKRCIMERRLLLIEPQQPTPPQEDQT